MRPKIERSLRNTIGDGLRRAARRDLSKAVLDFKSRSWTFARERFAEKVGQSKA